MRRLTVVENVTLDGVMQSPGSPEEDPRGGFTEGGWAIPYSDEVMAEEMFKGRAPGTSEMLFGRRTYEQFHSYWPNAPRPNPFSDLLDATMKYVCSTTLDEPLPWQNSTLLAGEAAETVADLKQQDGKDLVVLGSRNLVQTLLAHELVDEMKVSIHPLVLGGGSRLFGDGMPKLEWKLVESVPSTTGVIIATYAAP